MLPQAKKLSLFVYNRKQPQAQSSIQIQARLSFALRAKLSRIKRETTTLPQAKKPPQAKSEEEEREGKPLFPE